MEPRKTELESDSIRVGARDLILALRLFRTTPETSLNNIRLRICVDRERSGTGDTLAATARDVAVELQKLELVKGGPYPKTKVDYLRLKDQPIRITPAGRELLQTWETDMAVGYDALFRRIYSAHRYVRDYARILATERVLVAPALSSFKDHVAPEYASAVALREDVTQGRFRSTIFLELLSARLRRKLVTSEQTAIEEHIQQLLEDCRKNPNHDDPTTFAKSILSRLNDIVVPVILGSRGLPFDFRTHRAIWSLGEEFKVWASTNYHPAHDASVIFATATLTPTAEERALQTLEFTASYSQLSDVFLERLHQSYMALSKLGRGTLVPALELRAHFCVEYGCQRSTFNRLFADQHARDDTPYRVHTEIQRQKPRYEEPVRAGNRNVGFVLVAKE